MSRAFTREDDNDNGLSDIGERPVSAHRNLVTPAGLAAIDKMVADLREEFAKAESEGNRERMALASRDLRYWVARRESAEVSVPEPDSKVVRFGMTVTVENEDGKSHSWKIVGEDEADAAHGMISHVSPMAQALFGKKVGDLAVVNGKEWEIVRMEVEG
ncbi:transcription elongation factor GreA [Allomesorhizobium alhagi]|jgi:transcription elongation GreA/GreB family factor|uniref:Transcription elongation factor GreA/GreB domain-containing protein n=1 Tax=Mesorhizobium alhagi CCNWXJ12-2 TaxID=1107882 RepID=H0I0B2_9HYPH|nr:transcription elongation factor GreA [Mesorhizobium alhagi]EHK53572.1 transcription elongation factor GreA/GreB domain-containing protein [Mesorhizobium alhagi CCNWXJ12-2]